MENEKNALELRAEPEERRYKYDAFISYRHCEPDQSVAARLHSLIESFSVPKEFYRNGVKPSYRIFRDREELTTRELSDSIEEALRESRFLIVICSRSTPLSPWCVKEVETFIRLHGSDRIIPVLLEGEPSESFPPPLRQLKKTILSETGEANELDQELLAAELRPAKVQAADFVGYQALAAEQSPELKTLTQESLKLLNTEKYRIMAAMLGCSYGDLKQREKERRTRRLLQLTAFAAALLLVFGLFMFRAYSQANAARRAALQDNSAMLLTSAKSYQGRGDPMKALLIARRAMNQLETDMPLYKTLQNRYVALLNDSVYSEDVVQRFMIDTGNRFTFTAINPDSRSLAAGLGSESVGIWDLKNGSLLKQLGGFSGQVKVLDYSPDGDLLCAGGFDRQVKIWETENYVEQKSLNYTGSVLIVRFSKDKRFLNVLVDEDKSYVLYTLAVSTWEPAAQINLPKNLQKVYFSPTDAKIFALLKEDASGVSLSAYDTEKGQHLFDFPVLSKEVEGLLNKERSTMMLPYKSAAVANDGKSLIALADGKLYAYDTANGKLLWSIAADLIYSDSAMKISKDGRYLYVGESINLYKFDIEKKQQVLYFSLGAQITDLICGPDGLVAAILKDGGVAVVKDDHLIAPRLTYGEGRPEYVYMSEDGHYLPQLSLTDKTIKVAEIARYNMLDDIPGQFQKLSPGRDFALFYENDRYFVWDNRAHALAYWVKDERLPQASSYATWSRFAQLSPDGRLLAGYFDFEGDKDPVSGKIPIVRRLLVMDLESGRELINLESKNRDAILAFYPDSAALLALHSDGRAERYALPSNAPESSWTIESGWSDNAVFAPDASLFALNFAEGYSRIYRTGANQYLAEIPGKVLSFSAVPDKGMRAAGLFNNEGFFWSEADGQQRWPLSADREQLGADERDVDSLDSEADLLLSVRNSEQGKKAFLLRFSSGEVLKSFALELSDYDAGGYLAPDAKSVTLSRISQIQFADANGETVKGFNSCSVYRLLDPAELFANAESIVQGRVLTGAELEQIGLKE